MSEHKNETTEMVERIAPGGSSLEVKADDDVQSPALGSDAADEASGGSSPEKDVRSLTDEERQAELANLLLELHSHSVEFVQNVCMTEGGLTFKEFTNKYKCDIQPQQWWCCYNDAVNCRSTMITNISKMLYNPVKCSKLALDKMTGAKYVEILSYINSFPLQHYKTLQKICEDYTCDPFLDRFLGEFNADHELLSDCKSSGVGCRDRMAKSIKNTLLKYVLKIESND